MSEDNEGPVATVVAAVSTVGATLYAILTGVLSGAFSMIEGILTLDPSVILSGAWFAPVSLITQQLGPNLAPDVPWTPIFLAAGVTMLGVLFYKYQRKRTQKA